MTTPDIAGLCERLRDSVKDTGYMGIERGCQTCSIAGLLNAEAADTLERQAAEIERLRGALQSLIDNLAEGDFISETRIDAARAALTGEDAAGSPTSQNTEPGLPFSDAGEP